MTLIMPGRQIVPVDSGWSWVILAATFLNLSLCSLSQAVGVFNLFFLQQFDTSYSVTAACGALQSSLITLAGPVASVLISCLGPRLTIVVGATFTSLGFFLTYFVVSFLHVFFTYGFMTGFGLGLCYATGMTNLGFYFDKYRNIAYGIALSALGVGTIAFPPLIDLMFNTYSLQGTMLVLSAVCCHMFAVALLTPPINYTVSTTKVGRTFSRKTSAKDSVISGNVQENGIGNKSEDRSNQEKSVLQSKEVAELSKNKISSKCTSEYRVAVCQKLSKILQAKFLLFCSFLFIVHIGLSSIRLHFAAYSFEQGSTTEQASLLVTILGIGNTISRFSVGLITNNRPRLMYFLNIATSSLAAAVIFSGPYMSTLYPGQIAFALLFSLFGNGFQAISSPLAIDILGLPLFNMANGIALMVSGVGILAGPPVTGLLYDSTSTYFYTFILSGSCYCLAALIMLSVLIIRQKQQNS